MENKKPYRDLGDKIRERRKSSGKSIKEVSADIAVDRTYISKVENGQIKPSLEVLEKIMKYLAFEMPDTLDLYKLAGYSGGKIKFAGDEKAEILQKPSNSLVTHQERNAAQILVPDSVNVLYTDSIFLTIDKYGAVLDIGQKLAGTNQHKIVARVGLSIPHMKALRDLLTSKLQDKE